MKSEKKRKQWAEQAGRQASRVHVGPGQGSSERRADGDGGGAEWEEDYPTKLGRERMSERRKVRTHSCLRV